MSQLTIQFQLHSKTSCAAAKSIQSSAATLRAKVFTYLKDHPGGLTDEEGINGLQMNPSTYRPRRIELQRLGMVVDSGRRRETNSGRSATVWMAAC